MNSERRRLPGLTRKTFLVFLVLLYFAGGLGMGVVFATRVLSPSSPKNEPPVAEQENWSGIGAPSQPGPLPADQDELPSQAPSDPRLSFLLLGYGGAGHDGAYLTDSMMVGIADPTQKTLTLLSIPRDSWVPLLFDGKTSNYDKLNTAYAYAKDPSLYPQRLARYSGDNGAGNFAEDTVSRLLGIPISNYLALDFDGFRQMINTVGGIDVSVPVSFSANYPVNDDPSIDARWQVVRFRKGVEHMNGERAIEFARAREVLDSPSEGTDFARSRRQRLIIEAFKQRLFEPGGLIRLPQLLPIAARHVSTDYPLMETGQLSQFVLGWNDVHIYQTALTVDNYLASSTGPGGAYVLTPTFADHSWTQIRAFARRLWSDPPMGVAMAETEVIVENDTGQPSLAARLSATLMKLGYRVGTPTAGQERAESRLLDRTGGRAALVAAQLEKDLGIRLQNTVDTSAGDSSQLVLALGANDARLADLTVPADAEAPSSAVGVTNFSGWTPQWSAPAPDDVGTATPTAGPTEGPTENSTEGPTQSPAENPAEEPQADSTPTSVIFPTTTPPQGMATASPSPTPRRSPPPISPSPTATDAQTPVASPRPATTTTPE